MERELQEKESLEITLNGDTIAVEKFNVDKALGRLDSLINKINQVKLKVVHLTEVEAEIKVSNEANTDANASNKDSIIKELEDDRDKFYNDTALLSEEIATELEQILLLIDFYYDELLFEVCESD